MTCWYNSGYSMPNWGQNCYSNYSNTSAPRPDLSRWINPDTIVPPITNLGDVSAAAKKIGEDYPGGIVGLLGNQIQPAITGLLKALEGGQDALVGFFQNNLRPCLIEKLLGNMSSGWA